MSTDSPASSEKDCPFCNKESLLILPMRLDPATCQRMRTELEQDKERP